MVACAKLLALSRVEAHLRAPCVENGRGIACTHEDNRWRDAFGGEKAQAWSIMPFQACVQLFGLLRGGLGHQQTKEWALFPPHIRTVPHDERQINTRVYRRSKRNDLNIIIGLYNVVVPYTVQLVA